MDEEWRDIPGYEGLYQVSNLGRVKSLERKDVMGRLVLEKIRKLVISKQGYVYVNLFTNGYDSRKVLKVHRLVAQAFIPNPENKQQVNHIDGNKANNRIENLEWATASENNQHAVDTGLRKQIGEDNSRAKLTKEQVIWIREHYVGRDPKFSGKALAHRFHVSRSVISQIVNNKLWTEGGSNGLRRRFKREA